MHRLFRALVLLALLPAFAGCADDLKRSIVTTRNHQGDLAYEYRNYADAAVAYRLALQVAPEDEHARAGLAQVQLQLADQYYQNSHFEDALQALDVAAKYDPQSVRLSALRSEVDSARVKRAIVVANYPAYSVTGRSIQRAYTQLKTQSNTIVTGLQRFDYTFDSAELTKAVEASYELNAEVGRLTNRLIAYRRSVEAGAAVSGEEIPPTAGSLLPLP